MDSRNQISVWQIVILILSVYALIAIALESSFALPKDVSALLQTSDTVICFVFMTDFFMRLWRAPKKLHFLKWNWIDFVASIPSFDFLRIGRVAGLIRVVRILRAFRSTKVLITFIFRNRAQSALTSAILICFFLVIFASIAILNCETSPDANIKTPQDALWWCYVTMTTVGYGDKFPLSTEGRIIAAILMTAGIGLFGIITGYTATLFMTEKKDEKSESMEISSLRQEIALLREEMQSLRHSLSGNGAVVNDEAAESAEAASLTK